MVIIDGLFRILLCCSEWWTVILLTLVNCAFLILLDCTFIGLWHCGILTLLNGNFMELQLIVFWFVWLELCLVWTVTSLNLPNWAWLNCEFCWSLRLWKWNFLQLWRSSAVIWVYLIACSLKYFVKGKFWAELPSIILMLAKKKYQKNFGQKIWLYFQNSYRLIQCHTCVFSLQASWGHKKWFSQDDHSKINIVQSFKPTKYDDLFKFPQKLQEDQSKQKTSRKNENHAASIFLFFVLFFPWKSKASVAFYGDQPMTIPRGYASPTELKWLLPVVQIFNFPSPQQDPKKHNHNNTTTDHHKNITATPPQKRPQHPHHYHKNSTTPQNTTKRHHHTTTNTPHHDQRTATKTQKNNTTVFHHSQSARKTTVKDSLGKKHCHQNMVNYAGRFTEVQDCHNYRARMVAIFQDCH